MNLSRTRNKDARETSLVSHPHSVLERRELDVRDRAVQVVPEVGVADGLGAAVLEHLHPVAEGGAQQAAAAEAQLGGAGGQAVILEEAINIC